MILYALQNEILALIEKQQGLMKDLADQSLLWRDGNADAQLTQAKLAGYQAALASDQHKVKSLESTIAVIGTMKAGKSTTINALVGEDVLPHRVTAMTTLPTLIRHRPGQKIPVLTLKNTEVFQRLINVVLDKLNSSGLLEGDRLKLQEAITTVESAEQIQPSYEGKEAIHKVLAVVNDTFRLAGHEKISIDLDAQLQHFTEISSLPTVEVEFRCLAGKPESEYPGSLALLDTPGPNEAGQSSVLKRILTEQIEKNASMVMLVMNYTQLNTEQDSEIRNQLRGIKDVFKDRSFVVVNRFDERKKGDLNEEQTRKLASELLNDSLDEDDFITEEQVFPISSFRAFIAENARQQIKSGISVKDFIAYEGNENFIAAAFGMADEDEVEEKTIEEIATMCDRLMKKSGYDLFLKNMLEKAYLKAGSNSLASALVRLKSHSAEIDRFSTVVGVALGQKLDDLNDSIRQTRTLIDSVEDVYKQVDSVKKVGIENYRSKAHGVVSDFSVRVRKDIGDLFSSERYKQIDALNQELKESQAEIDGLSFANDVLSWTRIKRQNKKRLQEHMKAIGFEIRKRAADLSSVDFGDKKEEAEAFIERSSEMIDDVFSLASESLAETLKTLENESKDRIQTTLFDEIKDLFSEYERQMRKKGFDFDVSLLDQFSLDVMTGTCVDFDFDSAVEVGEKTTSKQRKVNVKRSGLVHAVLKVVTLGWRDDYEEVIERYDVKTPSYKVSLNSLVDRAVAQVEEFCMMVDENLAREFEQTLVPAVDEVFIQVVSSIKSIEEAFASSKKIKEHDANDIKSLGLMLGHVKERNKKIILRVTTASDGLTYVAE